MSKLTPITIIVAGLANVVSAQFSVPDAPEPPRLAISTPIRAVARTYEVYYAAVNNTLAQPLTITGMQFRLARDQDWRPEGFLPDTWPTQDLTVADYRVELSKATATLIAEGFFSSLAPTFASHQVDPVVVRSGPLTIPANSFDGAGLGEHPWGPIIPFTSSSYTINPGEELVVLLRLTGYAPPTEPQAFFAAKGFERFHEDALVSIAGNTAVVPTGFSNPIYIRFVPEPATAGLLTLCLIALRRRHRP